MSLTDLRRARGLSQRALAEAAGVRQATVSAIERGGARPRRETIEALARALGVEPDVVARAASEGGARWVVFEGLDSDLASGLREALVAEWTHGSCAIEGNTLSLGETLFVLREGLTVGGKTLREHAEVRGHADALTLLERLSLPGLPVTIEHLHELHRAVMQGGPLDAMKPVGRFKVEANGVMSLRTRGKPFWHDYPPPREVPGLVATWLEELNDAQGGLEAYAHLHTEFVSIHPYADGNGRMARLLANLPLLRAGMPPVMLSATVRERYLCLCGDRALGRGARAFLALLREQYAATQRLVAEFQARQRGRDGA